MLSSFWVFFGWNLKKDLLSFSKSVPSNFSLREVSSKNKKYFRRKNALFGYFRAGIRKSRCHI